MHIMSIPLDRIDVGPRLRRVDPAWVELLAASMAERGQQTPIEVRPSEEEGRYLLIAGGHRMAAAEVAGLDSLNAIVTQATDDEAELAEIDENLMRRELTPLDRAVFLAARKDVWLRLHPETGHGKAKKNKGEERRTGVPSFDRATAERLGLDPRSIRRAVSRASIPADVRAMIAGHPVADSGAELDKLAAQSADMQRRIAAALTRPDAPARTVGAALAELAGPVRENRAAEAARQLVALMGAWRKAGRGARAQFLNHLEMEGEVVLPQAKERAA